MRNGTRFLTLSLMSLPLILISCHTSEVDVSAMQEDVTIVSPSDATTTERLAAKEKRRYLRAIGKVNCTWAKFNAAMKKVKDQKHPDNQKRLARQTALMHIAHGVYSVKVPANRIRTDLEYYVRVSSTDGQQITFPASASQINQTIVVNDGSFTN